MHAVIITRSSYSKIRIWSLLYDAIDKNFLKLCYQRIRAKRENSEFLIYDRWWYEIEKQFIIVPNDIPKYVTIYKWHIRNIGIWTVFLEYDCLGLKYILGIAVFINHPTFMVKLDNWSWLQTGQKLLFSIIFCIYDALRQVAFHRHLSQIRNIPSFSLKFLTLLITIFVEANSCIFYLK